MKRIIFLLGTARDSRSTKLVYDFVVQVAKARSDIEVITVDVATYPQTKTEGLDHFQNDQWNKILESANGMIIVSPEYNHGYPGELKMFLDNAYKNYKGMSVAICGVSNGPVGGARMAEQLKLVLSAFQMTIVNLSAYFSNVDSLFENSKIKDHEIWEDKINKMIDQVIIYSR